MGFPHSEIFGSKCAGNSPKLIAACHVLHRLSVPRHPPNALIVLNSHVLSAKRQSCDCRFRLVPCRGRSPQQNGLDLPVGVAALRNSRNSTPPDFQTSSDLRCQRTNCVPIRWWRQTGSNRRPPACKAGALPTELCPRLEISVVSVSSAVRAGTTARGRADRATWWAREDLNLRPHAYQAR